MGIPVDTLLANGKYAELAEDELLHSIDFCGSQPYRETPDGPIYVNGALDTLQTLERRIQDFTSDTGLRLFASIEQYS